MAKKKSLFSEEIIARDMTAANFMSSQVPEISRIRKIIAKWVKEIDSGQLELVKEEAIKPKFLIDFFSIILGFRMSGEHSQMALELKTFVDGTKADAGLGHFVFKPKGVEPERVYAVIEIKDAGTDLDDSSKGSLSAVSQAYEYAGKTEAKWLFVSNMKEIRLYENGSLVAYDQVLVRDLQEESNLARFLFLYHSVSVLNGIHKNIECILSASKLGSVKVNVLPSSSSAHIIDQLDEFIKSFDGLRVLDPYYIANQKPFNILDQDVDHFEHWHLFTLNPEIYALLLEVSFSAGEIELSDKLKGDCMALSIQQPKEKLLNIFKRLVTSGVFNISAVSNFREIEQARTGPNRFGFVVTRIFSFDEGKKQGITRNIAMNDDRVCQCATCTFNSFEFIKLNDMLSNAPNGLAQSFEHAYGHYLLASDKFLRSYHLLKKCLKEEFADEISPVLHFLIYFNLSKLRWPLKWYAGEIPEEILKETKHIDLERLIWDRFYEKRSLPVHKVLRALKDEELLERALNNVEEALAEMLSVYEKYKSGSSYIAVPNYTDGLDFNFRLLSSYANGNYLFYDRSGRFKYIIEKAFEGLLLSHATVAYPYRLKSFECSTLRTAVIHIATENLEKLLTKVPNLELQEKGKKDFVKLMQSYFGQFYQTTTFGGTELRSQMSVLLTNHYFRETIQRIFANFSLTCEKILWNKETWQNSLTDSISNFLEVEDFLYWFQLKKFGRFLEKQTILFTYNQLVKLLHISIDRHQSSINKYQHFIESLCKCLAKAYPDNRIKSERLFQKALASSYVDDNDLRFEILYHIFPVVDRSHQLAIIHEAKKRLAQSFDPHFYQELLWRNILDWDDGPYFGQLVRYMATAQNRGSITFNGKDLDMKDVTFYNFCVLTHFLRVPREQISLSSFENLTTIEQWLLDPVGFDYSQFDAGWLRSVGKAAILDLLKGRKEVIDIVERDLTKDFDAKLAEIKYRRLLAPK